MLDTSANLDVIFLHRCVGKRGNWCVRETAAGIWRRGRAGTMTHTARVCPVPAGLKVPAGRVIGRSGRSSRCSVEPETPALPSEQKETHTVPANSETLNNQSAVCRIRERRDLMRVLGFPPGNNRKVTGM